VAGAALIAVAAPLLITPSAYAASDDTWDRLAQCESSGNWAINTGNGYHGGLQFSPRTWTGFGGGEFASKAYQATRAQQIVVAERVLASQGWNAWPSCSRKLGIRGEAASQRRAPAAEPAREAAPAPRARGASSGLPAGYRVQPRDTLSKLAQRYSIPGGWRTIARANPQLANPNMIVVGQRLS
jgi:hypothetical protein